MSARPEMAGGERCVVAGLCFKAAGTAARHDFYG